MKENDILIALFLGSLTQDDTHMIQMFSDESLDNQEQYTVLYDFISGQVNDLDENEAGEWIDLIMNQEAIPRIVVYNGDLTIAL